MTDFLSCCWGCDILSRYNIRVVIICFWLIGVLFASMYLLNYHISLKVVIAVGVLSLIISKLSYMKINLTLRQHKTQVQEHVNQGQADGGGMTMNIARYKKTRQFLAYCGCSWR